MRPLSKHPDRLDFIVVPSGVAVTKFWLVDGRSIPLYGSEMKPADFDLEGTLVWCASLESPTTGERQGFVGLADLLAFLEQETAPVDADDPRSSTRASTNVP